MLQSTIWKWKQSLIGNFSKEQKVLQVDWSFSPLKKRKFDFCKKNKKVTDRLELIYSIIISKDHCNGDTTWPIEVRVLSFTKHIELFHIHFWRSKPYVAWLIVQQWKMFFDGLPHWPKWDICHFVSQHKSIIVTIEWI